MISTKAPSSHWEPIVKTPSRDFPTGLGARWRCPEPVDFSSFLDRWGRQIYDVIRKYGLVVLPHTIHRGQEAEIPIRSAHFGFHVDRGNREIPLQWHVSHLRMNPATPDRDPTVFAPRHSLIRAVRSTDPRFAQAADHAVEAHLHDAPFAELAKYARASRICYPHSWSEQPCSSVLYFADQHPLANRVLHARFAPDQLTSGVPRLISIQLPEGRFLR